MDGSLLVYNYKNGKHGVTRVSHSGAVLGNLLTTQKGIRNFILLRNNELLILHSDGTIPHVKIQDGTKLGQLKVPNVKWLDHGIAVDNDNILLVDNIKGEVIMYNIHNGQKNVVLKQLSMPSSIDKAVTGQGCQYIVCMENAHSVHVYSQNWELVTVIGERGRSDGKLDCPQSALVLPDNTIIVSDYGNNRVCRFTLTGRFLGHVLECLHGKPRKLALQYPDLWISYGDNIKCFQIADDK